jgi:ABC-type multidrug transport system ATPase subunit
VSIARAIVHSPSIVLLDEPYTGLDAAGASAFTDALLALRHSGAAMVLVTHNVAEGLAMATHAAVMIDGRLVRHEPRVEIDDARYAADYQAQVLASNQAGHAA